MSSLPAVRISSGVVISGGSVSVSNEPGQVLNIFDVDSRNWLTHRHYETLCVVSGFYSCGGVSTVHGPPDRFWIIEQISGQCSSAADSQVRRVAA